MTKNNYAAYCGYVVLSKIKYYIYSGIIVTNPQLEKSRNGLESKDISEGFGQGNFGCEFSFHRIDNSSDGVSILISWNDVFSGRKTGIQVWSMREKHRYLYNYFDNRKKNSEGLNQLLNMFYEELFGDRVQLLSLTNCYLRAQLSNTTTLMKINNSSMYLHHSPQLKYLLNHSNKQLI